MRICLISREFPPDTGFGGISTFVHDLALGLSEIGHEVEVLTLASSAQECSLNYCGIIVHRVAWQHILEKYQLLLTAMPYTHHILKPMIAIWHKFCELHMSRPFDVVEAPEMFAEGLFVGLTKIAPLVVRLHTPHFKFIDTQLHNIDAHFDHNFIGLIERLTIVLAERVTCPSKELSMYVSNDINLPLNKIEIIQGPIDTNKFNPDGDKSFLSDSRPNILFVGRLEERKGVYQLISAIPQVVAAVPSARFIFVGGDTNTAFGKRSVLVELKKRLKKMNCLDHVSFLGKIENNMMASYFRAADVCVLPSLYDNAPITCMEAMACGKPVIGTSAGGMPEYIKHGESGLIVLPGAIGELATAIIDLLADNRKCLEMGCSARDFVVRNLDRRLIAQRSLDLYREAIAEHAINKSFALYKHEPDSIISSTETLILSFDQMLYDLMYRYSWRFRLSHWFHMVKDRPRFFVAKAIVRIVRMVSGKDALPHAFVKLEKQIRIRESGNALL